MLKPDFPKKEIEKEKWKERKGRNEKKGKGKMKRKEKIKKCQVPLACIIGLEGMQEENLIILIVDLNWYNVK